MLMPDVNRVTLAEYAKVKTQTAIAKEMGSCLGAVNRMLKKQRQIYVNLDDQGDMIDAFEICDVPRKGPGSKKAAQSEA